MCIDLSYGHGPYLSQPAVGVHSVYLMPFSRRPSKPQPGVNAACNYIVHDRLAVHCLLLTVCPQVWGNATWAPDDVPGVRAAGRSFGAFLTVNWQQQQKPAVASPAGAAATGASSAPPVVAFQASDGSGDRRESSTTEPAISGSEASAAPSTCDIPACKGSDETALDGSTTGTSTSTANTSAASATSTANASTAAGKAYLDLDAAIRATLDAGGPRLRALYQAWGPLTPTQARARPNASWGSSGAGGIGDDSSCSHHSGNVPFVVDPLRTPLPKAPSHSMYCLYGECQGVYRFLAVF